MKGNISQMRTLPEGPYGVFLLYDGEPQDRGIEVQLPLTTESREVLCYRLARQLRGRDMNKTDVLFLPSGRANEYFALMEQQKQPESPKSTAFRKAVEALAKQIKRDDPSISQNAAYRKARAIVKDKH